MLKSLERDLQKRILLFGQFYMHVDFITFTKLSITYGSDTSGRKLGNGEQGQTPWKGRVNFVRVGSVFTSRKDLQNRVFWRFRSITSPI